MGEFQCNSPRYSCAKQYGIILCSHKQGGTLIHSACGQSVDFISQYELMTHEQSQLLHLVKSNVVKVPPRAESKRFPGWNSWEASRLREWHLFSLQTFFTAPLPAQASALPAGMCLGCLYTHYWKACVKPSVYWLLPCPASAQLSQPPGSLWPRAESELFPSHGHPGGLASLPNSA